MNGLQAWVMLAIYFLGTGGLMFYSLKRLTKRGDLDHDLLIRHDERLSKLCRDMHVAHERIRRLNGGQGKVDAEVRSEEGLPSSSIGDK